MMDTCPNCHRPLVSHASPRCNWCGAEILDEEYQKEAAEQRTAFRRYEAERVALEAARTASFGSTGWMGLPTDFWGNPSGAFSQLSPSWQGRMRWQAAYNQAQQQGQMGQQQPQMPQQAATPTQTPVSAGVAIEKPWSAPNAFPDANIGRQQQPAEEAPADPNSNVRGMCDHLEI